ncbi:prolactin-inducible protein homolog [Pipistrellus kuhlii]|uniref:Prolactin-inducible protein homolog n=1 Tax=Pipistrellus kuhlii TaxID=59472 RepID=A0A7J7WLZ6_PIPKU|nr:prolactin-inducible protein homolog [Pipistrellus kuhlii]KAF6338371.1 prolactin induced protein [Pipistrellus kuhlii]
MYSLQLLLRASHAALLLVLCLQLGINKAQEDNRQVIKMDFKLPQTTRANEEVTATLRVGTELRECMVIKTYLVSNPPVDGPLNYKYTACLCEEYQRTFFWDFQVNSTIRIAAVVDIIREFNICPDNMAVIPIKANRFSVLKMLPVA